MSEKILGTRSKDYYIQAGKKPGQNKILPWGSCFSTALTMALSIQNCDLSKIPGTHKQPEDRLTAIALDQNKWRIYSDEINWIRIKNNPKFSPIDWIPLFKNDMLPNQFYEVMCYILNEIYGIGTARQIRGVLFHDMVSDIVNGYSPVILGSFYKQPKDIIFFNHYVTVVGYNAEQDKSEIIINDPYPPNYKSKNGYNQRFSYAQDRSARLFNNGDLLNNSEDVFIGPWKVIIKNTNNA